MPVLISSLKTNSRGKIAKLSSMHCGLSGFSAKTPFHASEPWWWHGLRLPGRVRARPRRVLAIDWLCLNEYSGRCAVASYRCRAAAGLSLPLSQASRVGVIRSYVPSTIAPGTHCASQDDGVPLCYSRLKCHISFGEQLQYRPSRTDLGSDPWLCCSLKLLVWTTYLTSLCLNFPVYNRGARVSTLGPLDHSGGLFLVHSNVVSYHYLPETRVTENNSQVSSHSLHKSEVQAQVRLHGFSPEDPVQSQNQSVGCNELYLAPGTEFTPRPIQRIEEFRSLCDCRPEVSTAAPSP